MQRADTATVEQEVAAATRAGVLRTEALSLSRHDISRTDAQVVAMAEERSRICAVTIITGDPQDINLLVGLPAALTSPWTSPANSGASFPGFVRGSKRPSPVGRSFLGSAKP